MLTILLLPIFYTEHQNSILFIHLSIRLIFFCTVCSFIVSSVSLLKLFPFFVKLCIFYFLYSFIVAFIYLLLFRLFVLLHLFICCFACYFTLLFIYIPFRLFLCCCVFFYCYILFDYLLLLLFFCSSIA